MNYVFLRNMRKTAADRIKLDLAEYGLVVELRKDSKGYAVYAPGKRSKSELELMSMFIMGFYSGWMFNHVQTNVALKSIFSKSRRSNA